MTAPEEMRGEGPASLQQQLQAALEQLQSLSLKVQSLEARMLPPPAPPAAPPTASNMAYLNHHSRLVLPHPGASDRLHANGTAAERLRSREVGGSAAGRPPLSPSAASAAAAAVGAMVPRPMESELPMAATRMVMAQIVSPADSNGLDICMVRCSPGVCRLLCALGAVWAGLVLLFAGPSQQAV